MSCIETCKAYDAFESQLKTLCLKEFPCGTGSWREDNQKKKKREVVNDKVSSRFSVTAKDYGCNFEKTEVLEELVKTKKSPWNLDYSWSDEAKELRQIAIRSPWLINENFILDYFKTMRIVDKNVEEIDERFLKFHHLEELSLAANQLKAVNSRNLPPKLKVLELCANNISSLADLCLQPPLLQHLGLSHNKLLTVDDYITKQFWPQLLSLDLGHNSLPDLMDIIRKLQSLPKLRNLILQGNPLALVPGYRGYTIDSLRNLLYLDDINITADEKHHFKGLAKRKEYILDEAKVQLHVSYMKNIPMPDELVNPDDYPEYPNIQYKFYIQFVFLEDKSESAEIFQILHDDDLSQLTPSQAPVPKKKKVPTATLR